MFGANGAIFVLGFALLIGANAKKAKKKSDLVLLVEIQDGWKALWKNAAIDVATKCKANCDWAGFWNEEVRLRYESKDLIERAPQYKSTLGAMLQMTERGYNPAAHNTNCRPTHVHGRDDFCICAREHQDWQTDCDYAKDTDKCQRFLKSVCSIDFSQDEEAFELQEGVDIASRLEEKQASKNSAKDLEGQSQTVKELKRLQGIIDNLDKERNSLIEAHEENTKDMRWKPMLAKLDQRIKSQKDKILRDMDALVEKREQETKQGIEM